MAGSRSSISVFVDRWRQGESPSAQAVLREHPELAEQKSVVLDLAYEEFCLRREAGEQVAASTFCDQFPTYRKSLERLLGVHELLAGNSALESLSDETVWPEPGDEFLGFRLREELGKGALGRVYLGTEPALGNRPVVLKLALEGGREAEILGKLKHDHIVPIHSVRQDEETRLTAVCMPFLGTATLCDVIDAASAAPGRVTARVIADAARDHRPLETRRRSRPSAPIQLSPDYVNAVLKIGIDLASALAYAHSQGILHRDLKPSNVLVASDGTPMLLDFNLSSDEELGELRVGATLPYAAPEQLAALIGQQGRDDDRVDARSDIFSLAVVLYELLGGGLPFESPSSEKPSDRELESGRLPMEATARAILARQERGPAPLCRRSPSVDPAAAAVVERCLQLDPAKRPQSANELVGQLKRALSVRRRIARWSRGHQIVSAAIGAVACFVLALATVMIANRDPNFVRERKAGFAALKNGALDEAIDNFSQAIKDKPDDLRSLVGRAQAYMQKRDFLKAAFDFQAATKFSPAGVMRAWAGYCFGQENDFGKANYWNQKAVEAKFESPEIYNNWGYTLGKLAQPELAAARERLTTALSANPRLQPALFNRAMVEMAERNLAAGNYPPSDPARKDFAAAIKLEPHCYELLVLAAHFNMTLPDADNYRDETIDYLTRAIGLGLTSKELANNPLLNKLMAEPRVKEALAKGRQSQSVERVTMLPPSPIEALDNL
jgi:serine/threonine protein kinase/Tfp pilus assembly protein PilF